jgi:hypothetical protein
MSKVNCKDCQFYHNGRCEELGEYTTPGECECSWFAPKTTKTVVLLDHAWRLVEEKKPTVFDRITASPEVLAEKMVYAVIEKGLLCFRATLIAGVLFATREDAIAATVAKLKEVAE